MIDPLRAATSIAGAGLEAQSVAAARRLRKPRQRPVDRLRRPGADPYQRKTVAFSSEFDRLLGASTVDVKIDRAATTRRSRSSTTRATRPPTPTATSRCRTSTCSSRWPTCARPAARYEANLQMVKQARIDDHDDSRSLEERLDDQRDLTDMRSRPAPPPKSPSPPRRGARQGAGFRQGSRRHGDRHRRRPEGRRGRRHRRHQRQPLGAAGRRRDA